MMYHQERFSTQHNCTDIYFMAVGHRASKSGQGWKGRGGGAMFLQVIKFETLFGLPLFFYESLLCKQTAVAREGKKNTKIRVKRKLLPRTQLGGRLPEVMSF